MRPDPRAVSLALAVAQAAFVLLRPDATFLDRATNRAERIFPRGSEWLTFRSQLPGAEVFANSVLDPAIGIAGELGVQAFASADWRNWTSAIKIGLFELSTRVGLPPLKNQSLNEGLAVVFDTLELTTSAFGHTDNVAEIVPELLNNAGMQVLTQVLQLAGASNPLTFVVTQVIQIATWAVGVARARVEDQLGKNISFPPLQSEDPSTDTWQVSRVFEVFRARGAGGVAFPDGKLEPASNADYTSLYLPAYRSTLPWQIQYRQHGIAAQQGYGNDGHAGTGTGGHFDAAEGANFGFMPGTSVMLRVLQASWRLYHTVRADRSVDRYTLRCVGVDKPCYKSTKTFDGSRDCRQCVDPESVWPLESIANYGGLPLNTTTPGENTGVFFPSANKLLTNLLDMITQPGPLLYTIDPLRIRNEWLTSFERFWEFAAREWRRYPGTAWRGLISRLASLMTAFEHEGQLILGGRELWIPQTHLANPRDNMFAIPFKYSIFSQVIEPFCAGLVKLQRHYLDTFNVAYIPPGAGALFTDRGDVRNSDLAAAFVMARRNLLNANRRMLVDLRRVTDPEFKAELERAGVKVSPVNAKLSGPGIDGHELLPNTTKPRRVPARPKVVRVSPLAGAVKLMERAEKLPPRAPIRAKTPSKTAIAVGVAAGAAALTVAGVVVAKRLEKET